MLSISLVGRSSLIARMQSMPTAIREELYRKVTQLTLELDARVIRKLNGEVLKVRSGQLRRSIFHRVIQDANQVIGKVGSSGDVPYAAIHEFGGTIHHPGGTAYFYNSKEGRIAFVSNAKARETMRRTRPHPIHMPERSFLRSSLADMATYIKEQLREAVVTGMKMGKR